MTPPKLDGNAQQIFLGRQSIVDRGQNLCAFELLFRSGTQNRADIGSATAATATVINFAFNELGIESVLGNYRGFINLDAEMLLSDTIEMLPRDRVVLEILETVEPTPEIIERVRFLRESGFTLAMDDFVHFEEPLGPLLQLAHIVKVDLQLLDRSQLAVTVDKLRQFGVQLLAEKVDNPEQFQQCLDLGFDMFQGYYFAKPQIIAGKRLSSSEMVLMRLLGLLMTDADTPEIEQVFKQDPGLSVTLLRMVNSVANGGGAKVKSLASALLVLGRRQVQRWLQLLLFAQLSPCKEFPSPLLHLAATRGKFMELMAAGDKNLEDSAFMTGIMSLMDALLGLKLPDIIATLPISDDVSDALLNRKGRLGRLLMLAMSLERNDALATAAVMASIPGCTAEQVNKAQALVWANGLAQPA